MAKFCHILDRYRWRSTIRAHIERLPTTKTAIAKKIFPIRSSRKTNEKILIFGEFDQGPKTEKRTEYLRCLSVKKCFENGKDVLRPSMWESVL